MKTSTELNRKSLLLAVRASMPGIVAFHGLALNKTLKQKLSVNTKLGLVSVIMVFLGAFVSAARGQGVQAQIPTSEYNALVDLNNATNGAGWTIQTGWLNPAASSWYGVTITGVVTGTGGTVTQQGHVTNISIAANELSGTIPSSLGNLTNLQYLFLGYNQLSGTIPASLGNLANLLSLDLDTNQLSGTMPASMGGMTNLEYIDLDTNQLSGTIPGFFGNLTNLEYVYLYANQLSGTIPDFLGNLVNLQSLDLDTNQLSGTISGSFSNLTNLEYLDLDTNQISGTIPAFLGNLPYLYYLDFSNNMLGGDLPSTLENLPPNQDTQDPGGPVIDADLYINIASNNFNVSAGSEPLQVIDALLAQSENIIYTPQNGSIIPGAVSLGGGWNWSSWFGYFAGTPPGWIYHEQLGWLYLDTSDTSTDIWIWTSSMGWIWTNPSTFPNLFRASDSAWLWYDEGTTSPCWFYNLTAGKWESH